MKKIFVMIATLLFTASLFAEPKTTGITDSDVKNFIKNSNAISKEFEEAGIKADKKMSSKQKKAAEVILQKYGIEAPAVEKYKMINNCLAAIVAEMQWESQPGSDEEKAIMEKAGLTPFALLKLSTNSKDYEVVKANALGVIEAMKNITGQDVMAPAQ